MNNQDGRIQDVAVAAYVKLVRTAEALHSEVSRGLSADGLTASQFSTLKVLRIQGPLAQRDIAKHLLKTGGNITVVVDNLERAGLVTRIRDTDDRRVVFVKITRAGEDLFDRIYPGHLERIRKSVNDLNGTECERLIVLLDRIGAGSEDTGCLKLEAAETSEAG